MNTKGETNSTRRPTETQKEEQTLQLGLHEHKRKNIFITMPT